MTAETETDVLVTEPHPSAIRPWLFKPGQSGNPNGRPRDSVARYIRERLETPFDADRNHAQALVDSMMSIALQIDGLYPAQERIRAASTLWDRAYGTPRQSIEVTSDGDDPRILALQALAAAIRGSQPPIDIEATASPLPLPPAPPPPKPRRGRPPKRA